MSSIAVLLTCFNRKRITLRCLQDLANQRLPQSLSLSVYLVDDASTDGTRDAVRTEFPSVHLLDGNGLLFWGGGMRLAFGEAMKVGYDFFLWLNDDVALVPDAIARLIDSYCQVTERRGDSAIIVGATCDPDNGCLSYSGRRRDSWRPLRFDMVPPDPYEHVSCDTMNGNVVLISNGAAQTIGNIDARFTHQIGDLDYGLRARRAGIPLWISPGFIGVCRRDTRPVIWKSAAYPLGARMKAVNTPPGGLPFWQWMLFAWRHRGLFGIVAVLVGFREIVFPKAG
jgi:GT2 family glycosyltransferase